MTIGLFSAKTKELNLIGKKKFYNKSHNFVRRIKKVITFAPKIVKKFITKNVKKL
jgi:hypothetical protein